MDGDFALDTSIVIQYFNRHSGICSSIEQAACIVVTNVVIGELCFGAYKSAKVIANLARIESFKSRVKILNCDAETANIYGKIKSLLSEKGRPIPDNDIWIAAMAMQHDLTLVSRDAHFNEVEGLKLVVW
ncbi:MAG: type II toxin-antitoxin system VapC family toxin [Planctomycetota bacterium]